MKRGAPPLTLRHLLRRRSVLSSTCADLEERAHVAIRFGAGADLRRGAAVHEIGHRIQRARRRPTSRAA